MISNIRADQKSVCERLIRRSGRAWVAQTPLGRGGIPYALSQVIVERYGLIF